MEEVKEFEFGLRLSITRPGSVYWIGSNLPYIEIDWDENQRGVTLKPDQARELAATLLEYATRLDED